MNTLQTIARIAGLMLLLIAMVAIETLSCLAMLAEATATAESIVGESQHGQAELETQLETFDHLNVAQLRTLCRERHGSSCRPGGRRPAQATRQALLECLSA